MFYLDLSEGYTCISLSNFCTDPNYEAERQLIIQKSAEYSSRAEQLYRYSFTAVISSHPDASQHAITHDRKSLKSKSGSLQGDQTESDEESWNPKSDVDILLEKAYVSVSPFITFVVLMTLMGETVYLRSSNSQ